MKAIATTVGITAVAIFIGGGALMYGPEIVEFTLGLFATTPVEGG